LSRTPSRATSRPRASRGLEPRYENPALDVTAGNHRAELAERYEAIAADESFDAGAAGALDAVVARVTQATESDEAPDGEGLTTTDASVESFVLIESDPEAVPTFAGGVAVANGVPEGDHRLTVNGARQAPHSEQLTVSADEPVTAAGVDGDPLVARRTRRRWSSDAESDADLTRTAIEDDFAGRIYDSAIDGSDAVYVHAGGAYTTEVRDADDEIGAYRVNPEPRGREATMATMTTTTRTAGRSPIRSGSSAPRPALARRLRRRRRGNAGRGRGRGDGGRRR